MFVLAEFSFQFLAGSARTGSLRAAGLRHEAIDHAVENNAVVKSLANKLLDPGYVSGRKIGFHFNDDRSLARFHEKGVLGILDFCHLGLLGSLKRGLFRLIVRICRNLHLDDLVRIRGWFTARDIVDKLHSVNDFPEDRILAVQPVTIVEHYEKTASWRCSGWRHGPFRGCLA